jgi:hypothetical protein
MPTEHAEDISDSQAPPMATSETDRPQIDERQRLREASLQILDHGQSAFTLVDGHGDRPIVAIP